MSVTHVLGGSGGIVNSLDVCPRRLSPLAFFFLPVHTFFTMEGGDSEFVNFTLFTLNAVLEASNQKCVWQQAITCCSCYKMPQNARTIFSTLHPLSTVIFATATVLAFVLLRNSSFNFHFYTQREATPTQKSARKCAATSQDFLRGRLQSAFTLANQLR